MSSRTDSTGRALVVSQPHTPYVWRVVENQLQVYLKFWRGPLIAYVVTPTLFLAALGVGVGGLISQRSGSVGGVTYLEFVAPGLIASSAMQAAAGASMWPVMGGLQWVRTFHAMIATPIEPREVYAGLVLFDSLRTGIGATIFLIITALFGGMRSFSGVLAVPAAVLCAAAVAAPLTAFTATQETDNRFPVIMRLGVMPLFLFSGAFFPISQLPHTLRGVVWVSPLYHGVELARRATTGHLALGPMAAHTGILLAIIAVGSVWGFHTFTKRLKP
jgi:lipooligosaccharide transport system permease protein